MKLSKRTTYFTIFLIILFSLVVGVVWFLKTNSAVALSKYSCRNGEDINIKVKNLLLSQELCLSSCYPYYLQRKNESGEWKTYEYAECPFEDKIETCISPLKGKEFKTSVPQVKEGTYRVMISVCKSCSMGERFKKEGDLFSEEFEVVR